MLNPPTFFSSIEYYRNRKFQQMMRKWNTYLDSEEPNINLLVEWEEILLKDFRTYANEWLKTNKKKTAWRKDLI